MQPSGNLPQSSMSLLNVQLHPQESFCFRIESLQPQRSAIVIELSPDQQKIIQTHAEQAYPEECCGLLLGNLIHGRKILVEVRSLPNAWESATNELNSDADLSKSRRYWIDPAAMLAVMRDARSHHLEIIGVYHSHPNHAAVPSECDRQLAWQQYSYLIVSVHNGIARDFQSWCLDDQHQFQPEVIQLTTAKVSA
jgi:proteasome lid subunit RPN8/RPN11